MHLQGAKALVTGAAQGLGKAFSEALLRRGAQVCLSDVQIRKGKEVEQEFQEKYGKDKAIFIPCNVKSGENFTSMFREAVSKFGHIDLLVNNAGIFDESRLQDMVDINLVGLIKGTEIAVDHMRRDQGGKGGVVVNIASTAGLIPVYFVPSYAATKHGVVGFTLSWASNPHFKEIGVQFACVCPAFTQTAMLVFDEKKCQYVAEAESFVEKIGINEVQDVVAGFVQLVESNNCNGDVVTITQGEGIRYAKKNGKSTRPRL